MIGLPLHFPPCLLALAVFFGSASPVFSGVKLAVWGSADQRDATACLIAELSGKPDAYTVLEREQLDRVAAESTLQTQGFTLAKATEAARMLGADGVLWAEGGKFKGRPVVITRLCAVASGVVVGWQIDDAPLPDPAGWAKLTVNRVDAWRVKLGIARDRAIPISLVDIRSATESATANESGQTLRSLLGARLTAQPEVFVLERWRMEELGWESVLGGDVYPAFWNGAWLLDGSVTEAAGKVELSMRLRAADGKDIRWVRQGRDTDLKQLVTDLTADVLERVPRGGTQAGWDAEAEAREFFAEAEWAARSNLNARALQSSEAAIALGLNSIPVQRMRYITCSSLASDSVGAIQYPLGRELPTTRMPDESTITRSLRAIALFNDLRNRVGRSDAANPTWASEDSIHLVYDASRILWSAYFAPRNDAARIAPVVVRLRYEVRELFEREFSAIEKDLQPHPADRLPPVDRGGRLWPVQANSLPLVGIVFGALWAERSTDHEQLVSKLLGNQLKDSKWFYDDIYQTISCGHGSWAVDWETHDARRAISNWERYFRSLLKEKPLCLRIAASLWLFSPRTKFAEGGRRPASDALPEEFWEPFVDHVGDMMEGRVPVEYFLEVIEEAQVRMPLASRNKLIENLGEWLSRPGDLPVSLARLINCLALCPENKDRLSAALRQKIATSGTEPYQNKIGDANILSCLRKLGMEMADGVTTQNTVVQPLKPMLHRASVHARAAWLEPGGQGIRWVTLIGDQLWVVAAPPRGGNHLAPPRYHLGRISLPEWQVEEVLSWQTDRVGDLEYDFPSFAILAGSIYSWEYETLYRRKIEGGQKEEIPLPITKRPRIWAVNDKLYLGLQSGGVLRVEPETKTWELLADSKRRPAQGVLDDCSPYQVQHIWLDPRRGLCVMTHAVYAFDEPSHQWNGPTRLGSTSFKNPFDRSLALHNLNDMTNAGKSDSNFTLNLLLADVGRKGVMQKFDAGSYFGGEPTIENGQAHWSPIGCKVENSNLWALFHYPHPDRAPHLVWMPELPGETVALEVKFPKEALARIPMDPARGWHYQGGLSEGGTAKMILSRDGLAFYMVGGPALWFIPRQELEVAGISFLSER